MVLAAQSNRKPTLSAEVRPVMALASRESAIWEQIRSSCSFLYSPFLSFHYIRAVSMVRPYVYVCVIKQDDHIAGFLPFQFRSSLHRALGIAERVGEEMTDYFGLIAETGFRCNSQDLLRLANLNGLNFSHLDQSQLDYGLDGERPEVGLMLDMTTIPDWWTEIRKTDRKFGMETERLERQIQREHGAFRFTFDERDWQPELSRIINFKGDQYSRTGRRNLFHDNWRRRLLTLLADTHQPGCSGVLSTLWAGNTWIASHFGIRSGQVLQYWFPVYNPEMKRYAPGRLLFKQVMQAAPQYGVRIIDRGSGDNQAKRQLSNTEHRFYRGLWHRPGLRSLPGRITLSVGWRLLKRAPK